MWSAEFNYKNYKCLAHFQIGNFKDSKTVNGTDD